MCLKKSFYSSSTNVGMGCVGLNKEGDIFFTSQTEFLGCNTTTLEFAGILIPFLSCPELLMNQTIVAKVDNTETLPEWMRNPSEDWDLPKKEVAELSNFLFAQNKIRNKTYPFVP